MLSTALIVFAIAAIGGVFLPCTCCATSSRHGRGWPDSADHHAGARRAGQGLLIGFVPLLITALGGFFLASFHLRKQLPPKAVIRLGGSRLSDPAQPLARLMRHPLHPALVHSRGLLAACRGRRFCQSPFRASGMAVVRWVALDRLHDGVGVMRDAYLQWARCCWR